MKRSYRKLGHDEIEEIFRMKKLGYSNSKIGRILRVHHTTASFWLGTLKKRPTRKSKNSCLFLNEGLDKFTDSTGAIINRGKKCYADYLAEQQNK